jgi:hypothetical protein
VSFSQHLVGVGRTREKFRSFEILIKKAHLWVNNEYFALWDSNFPVTKFICVSIAKTRIEWIIIRREKSFDILQIKRRKKIGKKTTCKCTSELYNDMVLFRKLPLDKQS